MKKILLAVVAISLVAAVSSDAGWFTNKTKRRFPRPIDSPIIRPKYRYDVIPGNSTGHKNHTNYSSLLPATDVARG